jgi:hypothetical protein
MIYLKLEIEVSWNKKFRIEYGNKQIANQIYALVLNVIIMDHVISLRQERI